MTGEVVALFLIAPLIVVPLGYGLLEVATPRSRPPAIVLRTVPVAAIVLVVSFALPAGPIAAALALPWLIVTGVTALAAGLRRLADPDRSRPGVRHATDAAVAFLAVGAAFALTDRLGARPFDFPATIILLTAVHFHFAGFALPLAGALAYQRRPNRWLALALGGVIVGIPVTALGFFGVPVANWIGAVLTAVGGFGIGLATLLVARTMARRSAVGLTVLAGVSLLVSMPMAVIYTTGVSVGTTWLDLSTMAAVHGSLNALGFALPATIAWTLDRRARATATPDRRPARDPRRLGLGAAGIIAGYALVIGAISAGAGGLTGGGEFAPPQVVPRPLLLIALGMLPAALAAIGALRRSRPVLIAAGLLCLGQAFIAFSGVTIPFVVPAFLLLAIGIQDSGTETPWRAVLGGVFVVALGIGAWVAPFALTETTCWVARTGADGAVVYVRTPVPENATFDAGGGQVAVQLNPGDLASGCGGGELTVQGAGLAAVFEIGAVALAALASMAPPATKAAREEFA